MAFRESRGFISEPRDLNPDIPEFPYIERIIESQCQYKLFLLIQAGGAVLAHTTSKRLKHHKLRWKVKSQVRKTNRPIRILYIIP